ncbi:MAG: hypothetical protein WD993_00340 [Thermoleophilaceae bacterium]
MGVLDDAIRAHLELRRQHGAPEAEVQQKAQEALGAPRREEAERQGEPGPGDEPPAEAPVPDSGEETPAHGDPATEIIPPSDVDEPPAPADQDEPDASSPPTDPEADAAAEPDWGFDDAVVPSGDTLPRGFEPVDDAPPAEGADGEDVLEETPEFLQETPEHDRLWFEQKPPRDFDFDEE